MHAGDEVLAFHARARLLANLTRTSELFRALGEADREALLARLSTELVPAGTRFITEGAANQRGTLDHPDLTFLAGRTPASPPRIV